MVLSEIIGVRTAGFDAVKALRGFAARPPPGGPEPSRAPSLKARMQG